MNARIWLWLFCLSALSSSVLRAMNQHKQDATSNLKILCLAAATQEPKKQALSAPLAPTVKKPAKNSGTLTKIVKPQKTVRPPTFPLGFFPPPLFTLFPHNQRIPMPAIKPPLPVSFVNIYVPVHRRPPIFLPLFARRAAQQMLRRIQKATPPTVHKEPKITQ